MPRMSLKNGGQLTNSGLSGHGRGLRPPARRPEALGRRAKGYQRPGRRPCYGAQAGEGLVPLVPPPQSFEFTLPSPPGRGWTATGAFSSAAPGPRAKRGRRPLLFFWCAPPCHDSRPLLGVAGAEAVILSPGLAGAKDPCHFASESVRCDRPETSQPSP
jgi:hypothetical protein